MRKYTQLSFVLPAVAFNLVSAPTQAVAQQVVFSEAFSSSAVPLLEQISGVNAEVEYLNYAALTVNNVAHSIPEAPSRISGSEAQVGAFLRNNYSGTARTTNLVLLASLGSRLAVTDNYRVKFDSYLRLSPSVSLTTGGIPVEAGTTELLLWGVGYTKANGIPMGRVNRTTEGNGSWGWLSTEGGINPDAALWLGTVQNAGHDHGGATARPTYFTPAFGANASPVPHAPANQWVTTTITVSGGRVSVDYQAEGRTKTRFFESVPGLVTGGVMIGYEDPFTGSTSFDAANQWMLLDNITVEDITPPTLAVDTVSPVATYSGGPGNSFTYSISNLRTSGDLTISQVNFTGASAAAYSVVTPLPLVVPASTVATLELKFLPQQPNGLKTASIQIVSNDPQRPQLTLPPISGRRAVDTMVGAWWKLDETSGATLVDSSGAGTNAILQIRNSPTYGTPSLQFPTQTVQTGTSLGLLPANSSVTGSYFTSNVTHTPSFSVAMWIKPQPSGSASGLRTLFQRDLDFNAVHDDIFGLVLGGDGKLAFRVRAAEVLATDVGAILDDTVYHVAVTHKDADGFKDDNNTATRTRLYVNGVLVREKKDAEAVGFGEYPAVPVVSSLHFASRTVAGFGYQGDMDNVHVHGDELSKEQIWALAQQPGVPTALGWGSITHSLVPLGGGNRFSVTVPASPSGNYQLLRSGNLLTWDLVGGSVAGPAVGSTLTLTDDAAPAGRQFYQVLRD